MRKRIAEDPRMPSTAIAAQKTHLPEDKDTAFLAKKQGQLRPPEAEEEAPAENFPYEVVARRESGTFLYPNPSMKGGK